MKHEVQLDLVNDSERGYTGFVPTATWSGSGGSSEFDPFIYTRGIIHDIIEHWFEHQHKYFKGHYAKNYLGEIVAHGVISYVAFKIDSNLYINPVARTLEEDIALGAINPLVDPYSYGYTTYGEKLMSMIPKQPKVEGVLHVIEEHTLDLLSKYERESPLREMEDKREREAARILRSSCTEDTIRSALRYGWRMGQRMMPDVYQASTVLWDLKTSLDYHFGQDRHKRSENSNNCDNLYNNGIRGLTAKVQWGKNFKCRVSVRGFDYNGNRKVVPLEKIENTWSLYD